MTFFTSANAGRMNILGTLPCRIFHGFSPACLPIGFLFLTVTGLTAADPAWFADGYHGGIYGHYPASFTQFIVDALRQNPHWKLKLEIEPETWDFARTNTPEAYEQFKALLDGRQAESRIEFVNPAYGQSYLWNISGESVIQQFERGMRKLHEHFPAAALTTYCSEEPCFTSALPGILKSFGFKYAVLKNPNTCWGGYTRAFGGELVNWRGPDGTELPTVPRYAVEALKPGSTWETIAAVNSRAYIEAARQAGIVHPVGMCLQDAGWRWGPWLKRSADAYNPSEYVTWRQYFETVATFAPAQEWRVSQEDILVSLVWGSQVLQRIAQQVRNAENRLVIAEKLATLAAVEHQAPWPAASFDEAWRTLLLAQHHDCWIVPYNGRRGDTWADKVRRWTDATRQAADASIGRSMAAWMPAASGTRWLIRVFNTVASARTNLVSVELPNDWPASSASIRERAGRVLASQVVEENGVRKILFPASAPSCGYHCFWLETNSALPLKGATAAIGADGRLRVETDLYHAELDPAKGGVFTSLVAKGLGGRELVDAKNARCFNELRGYFPSHGKFCSTADTPAKLELLETGPLRVRIKLSGQVASNAVTQWLTFVQGEPRIDCRVRIDWQGSPRVGADNAQFPRYSAQEARRPFYDARDKLSALFPLNLTEQKVFKDAPFDVTESRLSDTFFDSWMDIKNDVLLNWVDVLDRRDRVSVALLSDHTTSYAHGPDYPLGLTLQYSGVGLWGRNYSIDGPTDVHYALLPHAGTWREADLWTAADFWNEPLEASVLRAAEPPATWEKSLLTIEGGGWEVLTMRVANGKVMLRLFNASGDASPRTIKYTGPASKMELLQLNGKLIRALPFRKEPAGAAVAELALPTFGIATLKITP